MHILLVFKVNIGLTQSKERNFSHTTKLLDYPLLENNVDFRITAFSNFSIYVH